MLIVHVHVRVQPEFIDAFKEATIENARNSVLEAGIARFDVIQESEAPEQFVLIEVYRSAEAAALHRETAHYQTWRDTVEGMMAEPRTRVKYTNVFPGDVDW